MNHISLFSFPPLLVSRPVLVFHYLVRGGYGVGRGVVTLSREIPIASALVVNGKAEPIYD